MAIKQITRCIELKREWHAERARLRAMELQASASSAAQPASGTQSRYNVELESVNRFLDGILREKPARFTPENLRDFTGGYAERVGSGGFGVVYRGRFPNGVAVAVKVLNGTLDRRAAEQFMAEVGTAGRTYHINLVRLYGFCFDASVKALVYEFLPNGLPRPRPLRRPPQPQADADAGAGRPGVRDAAGDRGGHGEGDQVPARGVRAADRALRHQAGQRAAGGGLFPEGGRLRAGQALQPRQDAPDLLTMTGGARGTPGYAAPELWLPLPVTHKCDVYSFGMLVFEILGRRRNYVEEHAALSGQEWYPKWVWQRFEEGRFEEVMAASGIRGEDGEKAERMCKVALWCVQYRPEARPAMSSVVRMLEGEEEIARPVNPFSYMASLHEISSSSGGDVSTSTLSGDSANRSSALSQ